MPTVDVPEGSSTPVLRAHLAVPTGTGPWPGVVVLHESLGLNNDIRQQAERFAAAGYLALAPDLFSRAGVARCLVSTLRTLNRGEGPATRDVLAARRWLVEHADCTGAVGVAGFCMGGGFALLLAPHFDASAASYGPLPRDPEVALAGACPVVASYGSRDPVLRNAAAKLESALTAAGVEHDVREYPGVGHSFLNRHRLGPLGLLERVAGFGHDEAAAEDAWRRVLALFDRQLRP